MGSEHLREEFCFPASYFTSFFTCFLFGYPFRTHYFINFNLFHSIPVLTTKMQFFNTAACVLLASGVAVNALPITDQAAALSPRAGTLQNPWVGKGWKYPDIFIKNPDTLKKLQNIFWGKPKAPKIGPLKTDGPPKAPTPVKGP
ncbi:hypothetical protein HYALB_00006118 [Hymenoscyphus albidus]|uniref:Uncharacterized protein n=1 Tax=Hymenoscyphus albidus TaxID=595503 RepID=A0A9N9LPN1_9HELO|nr:hypothetical protein HYALB_00006118 [Hymenoscyphus albidus]